MVCDPKNISLMLDLIQEDGAGIHTFGKTAELCRKDYHMAPTLRELKNSRNLLRQAGGLVARVNSLFLMPAIPELPPV